MTIDSSDFFVAGGTMRAQSPSYVTRPADSDLLNHLLAGEFCYVLTARQMGKSSLMVRTAQRLQEQSVQTAIIDLTSIGTVAPEAWYLGLLSRLRSGLRLSEVNVQAWWQAHAQLSAAQRFTLFLRDVVLGTIQLPVVIFIDEIDATLGLTFRDDFFAALRAIYNARANEPIYNRLTFALFGVATPTDLIQDRERTPFNIGHRINLQEFTYTDAEPLRTGLDAIHPGQGEPILQRIFFWTNGHPYLTQKLCAVIASQSTDVWDNSAVDQVVEKNFFSDEGRKDTNLTFVQDRIAASPELERRAILTLYRQVHQGKRIKDDDRSPVQNRLELYGLLRVDEKRLRIRNELYRRVFNADWIKANTPVNTQRQRAILAVGAMLVLLVGVVAYILNQPNPTCDTYTKQFNETKASALRIDALAGLFNANCRQEALTLFYDLSPYEQEELFLDAKNIQVNSLITTIKGIYVTLDTMPEPERHDLKLMSAMLEAMKEAGVTDNDHLVTEIKNWREGREQMRQKKYQIAVDAYATAITTNPNHPVIHFDRAEASIKLTQYISALTDLDDVIRIVQMTPPTSTPTATPIPLSSSTPMQISALPTPTQKSPIEPTAVRLTLIAALFPWPVSTITPIISVTPTGSLSLRFMTTERFRTRDSIVQTVKQTILENTKLSDKLTESLDKYAYLVLVPTLKQGLVTHTTTNLVNGGAVLMNSSVLQAIWVSQAELAQLPMAGSAWERIKATADLAATTPTLGDQDSEVNTIVLAKALVYTRTGTAKYRDEVITALDIITHNNTENGGITLSVGRKLAAYVIAADLIKLSNVNPGLDTDFRAKLRELLSKPFDTSNGKQTLREIHETNPNNWGTHAGASRIAVAIYLGDKDELERAAIVFHGFLGETPYNGFNSDDDLSWQADPAHPVGINPVGATKDGHSIDGAIPDDIRRGGPFQWPPIRTGYPWEALQGAVVQAELLQRAGYPAWSWENNALLRAVQFLYSIGWSPEGDDRWIPCLINHAYHTNLPVDLEATPGKNMGFTCWTHVRP